MQPTPFVFTARQLLADGMTSINRDRLIGGYEIQDSARLNIAKNLTKFGPILGLMGTLIPMGPALVGLSIGDVASMAYNMQVAFATTVIGLFSGGIGYILLQVKQRWIDRDLLNLDFLAGLAGSCLLYTSSVYKRQFPVLAPACKNRHTAYRHIYRYYARSPFPCDGNLLLSTQDISLSRCAIPGRR